jgi:hypothetical protein
MPSPQQQANGDVTVTLTGSVAEELVKLAGYAYVEDRWRSPISRRRHTNLAHALTAALVAIAEGEICLPSLALPRP